MALPQNIVSSPGVPGEFLVPDNAPYDPFLDFEMGGTELGDANAGRLVKSWTTFMEGTDVYVAPSADLADKTLVVSGTGITTIALAFDSNMNVTLAYMQDGTLKLYWYDLAENDYVITEYAGATSGRVSTDEKRQGLESISDVIFAYTRANNLYYRQQRDRYTIERLLGSAPGGTLLRMGMNQYNRMQFEVRVEI